MGAWLTQRDAQMVFPPYSVYLKSSSIRYLMPFYSFWPMDPQPYQLIAVNRYGLKAGVWITKHDGRILKRTMNFFTQGCDHLYWLCSTSKVDRRTLQISEGQQGQTAAPTMIKLNRWSGSVSASLSCVLSTSYRFMDFIPSLLCYSLRLRSGAF